jgi:hypothetical protein
MLMYVEPELNARFLLKPINKPSIFYVLKRNIGYIASGKFYTSIYISLPTALKLFQVYLLILTCGFCISFHI